MKMLLPARKMRQTLIALSPSLSKIPHLNFHFQNPSRLWTPETIPEWKQRYCTTSFSIAADANANVKATMCGGRVLVRARDTGKLSMEIEKAIDEKKFDEAWRLFEQQVHMDGLPRMSLVTNVLTSYVQTLDVHWVNKAYEMVRSYVFAERGDGTSSSSSYLEKGALVYLSLGLAKCSLPVEASVVLRKLLEMEHYVPVSAWSAVVGYMVQTPRGSYLAAELVKEIAYLFQCNRVDPSKKSNAPLVAMKPNVFAVNLVLVGCILFDFTRQAEQILDMLPRIAGVKVDANLLILMAHVYERNGRREELRKLERRIDELHGLNNVQFLQFYNCLLACYFKLGDLDVVCDMVLRMLQKEKDARNTLAAAIFPFNAVNTSSEQESSGASFNTEASNSPKYNSGLQTRKIISYEEFLKDRDCLKLEKEMKELLDTLLAKLHSQVELVTMEHGILQPTEKIYIKLVKAFLEAGRAKDLVSFLIKAEREESPASVDDSALVHTINACISIGWLDLAHDILDEMRLAGIRAGSSVYSSLLQAYCKENRGGEAVALLRDARRAGVQLDSSSYNALIESQVLQENTQMALNLFKEMKEEKIPRFQSGQQEFENLIKGCEEGGESQFMSKLLSEINQGQRVHSGVHDWNNVIHFFCTKRLMNDAEKALKKMRSLGHSPNAQTFHSMVIGYAACGGKYTEVTELWREMKGLAKSKSMSFDQELLDSVLYTFVRGGFFVRANEVVEMLEKGNMFVDKYKYRTLFLKYHKTLYKGKAPKFQTESQLKKREAALFFKKWVGLN